MSVLGEHSVETFLAEYWQKRPLVIRNAFPDLESPVSSEELAGLACESEVESRLVLEEENGKPWQLHSGPFEESRFQSLPASHWTLLVQGLDYWVPEIADLLEPFRFIPNWRLDDIMASYAPVGGSVGPHYDQYDVFLLQAEGQRRWKVGGVYGPDASRVEGTPLHILREFETIEEYVLNPGDMLYLPPGVAHWGIAENDCMTLSIGFRTPSHAETLTGFTDYLVSQHGLGEHLVDPDPRPLDNPGRIDPAVIDELARVVRESTDNPEALANWFGQAMTEPKHAGIVEPPEARFSETDLYQRVAQGHDLVWNEGSRFAFHDQHDSEGPVRVLFADGHRFSLRGNALEFAPTLCAGRHLPASDLAPWLEDEALLGLLTTLANQGSLYDPEADDQEE